MSTSDEIRRADFEYLTGRSASVEEIVGSGTIRMHYANDGSIRQMACTAVDYHDSDIRAKLDARYPPENSPLIRVLVDVAMSAARNDPDGRKRAASRALTAAADAAVKRHRPTGRYLRELDQRFSGGRRGALFGLHVATVEVKQQLGLSGDTSKSLLWLAPIEVGHRPTLFELIGTRRKPLSSVASDLAILLREQLDLAPRLRGNRAALRKADAQRLEDWTVQASVIHNGDPARRRGAVRELGRGSDTTIAATNDTRRVVVHGVSGARGDEGSGRLGVSQRMAVHFRVRFAN